MTDTLTFYTNPMSRARVTRWMLEETGLPYDAQVLEYGTSMKTPPYLAINPMGKVPAIRHGDTVVTENAAICMYLADLVPDKKLAPPVGSHARGPYYRWISFMGPLEQLMVAKTAGGRLPDPGMAGFGNETDLVNTLEAAVKDRDHLAGDSFTAADLYLASHLSWGMNFGTIEKRPAFEAYVERHVHRPAALRADEIDNALIAAAQAPA